MAIETVEHVLPEYLATYAMHGESNKDDTDIESAYTEWMYREMCHNKYKAMQCVSITDDEGFMAHHELKDYGIGSCDCQTFTFHVTRNQKG